jgi:hypothetical protein
VKQLFSARFNQREGTPKSELRSNPVRCYPTCDCLENREHTEQSKFHAQELQFHTAIQDEACDAWRALEDYIHHIEAQGEDEFNPLHALGPEYYEQIRTLPASIGRLKSVRAMMLYSSHLVRIPPEIGEMTNLEEFDPYTSYLLHWVPYEIMRCQKLTKSRVSTRALYGNWKNRPPFPRLPCVSAQLAPARCSVCAAPFTEKGPIQMWISLKVATDVLPLLVHACSQVCIDGLPTPPQEYVQQPHLGGLDLVQPPRRKAPHLFGA